MAMTTSAHPARTGSAAALARTAGALPSGRWDSITVEGSTATTARPDGSYDPVPAPTLRMRSAAPRRADTTASQRGSARRCAV